MMNQEIGSQCQLVMQQGSYDEVIEEKNDRPFCCELCGKRFRQACHLQQHIRIHTNDRPYHCSFCDKKFKQRSQQNQHERIHTGEKPYQCPLCEKAFPQAGQLYSHKKTHGLNPKVAKQSTPSTAARRGRKRKTVEHQVVLSPSPVVYFMETFQNPPPPNLLYTHDPEKSIYTKHNEMASTKLLSSGITSRKPYGLPKPGNCTQTTSRISNTPTSCIIDGVRNTLTVAGGLSPANVRAQELAHNIKLQGKSGLQLVNMMPNHLRDIEKLIPAEHSYSYDVSK